MDNRELLADYQSWADGLLAGIEEHERQARDLKIEWNTVVKAIDKLRPLVDEIEDDLTGVVVDFTGCINNVDRLIRIARAAPHKLLNTTKVTQYLLDHGQSRSKLEHYRTEVNRALTQNPDLFERVGSGTYRYKGDSSVSIAEVGEAVDEATHGPADNPIGLSILEGPNVGRYGPVEG